MQDFNAEIMEMHAIVYGFVQGVGFRAMTRLYANQLALTGTVCNLPNGSVEIYAQGPKQNLEKLLDSLKLDVGEVKEIQVDYKKPVRTFSNFNIIF